MRTFLFSALLFLCLPVHLAWADIVTVRSGVATILQRDRDTDETRRFAALLTELSYRAPSFRLTLDLPLRFDSDNWKADERVWNREGDWLRPVEALSYAPPGGSWRAGLETLRSWTPGQGYLVRSLSGVGEVDYVLPGFLFRWNGKRMSIEAGTDRAVDPSVQAVAISFTPFRGLEVHLEGAVDPDAPLSFAGDFRDGRPVAAETEKVDGSAAGFVFLVSDKGWLEVSMGGHSGRMGDEAAGIGGDLTFSFDLSAYHVNRFQMTYASVRCRKGYIPAWFDGIYPLLRWGPRGSTLLSAYPQDGTAPDRRMEAFQIRYDLGDVLNIRGALERFDDDSMTRARLEIDLKEESGRGLEAVVSSRSDGPDEKLFAEDSHLYSSVSALYDLSPHLLIKATYEHSWAFDEEMAGAVPINAVLFGVMYNISF